MNTAKHTPGPWAVNDSDTGMSDDGTIINLHGMVIVSSVYGQTTEIAAANAALIAAAPAMYADGKVLCGLVRDFMNDNRLYDGQVIQAIHNLETALAQAEGK